MIIYKQTDTTTKGAKKNPSQNIICSQYFLAHLFLHSLEYNYIIFFLFISDIISFNVNH